MPTARAVRQDGKVSRMKTSRHTWVRALVIFGLLMALLASAATAFAELTEAEKHALEAELKAAELANEPPQDQQIQDPPANEAPAPPEPVEAPEPPAPPEPPQAPEPPGGGPDQGGGQAATGNLNGYISAIGGNSLTVGIIGDNTVTVTSGTYITYNGQVSNLPRLFIGDKVSVQFDSATNEALRIEVEGFGFSAIYQGVGVQITYIGPIGHWPQDFGMHAGGAGLKLGPSTQVTINGVPATIQDLQVGDTIDYGQSAIDLTALWVIVTR